MSVTPLLRRLVAGALLLGVAGCGGGGRKTPVEIPEPPPVPDSPPICTITATTVDAASRDLLVTVRLVDRDQVPGPEGIDLLFSLESGGVTYANDVLSTTSGTLDGPGVRDALHDVSPPGFPTTVRISGRFPDLLPADPAARLTIEATDARGAASTCSVIVDLTSGSEGLEPTCLIVEPQTGTIAGLVTVLYDLYDAQDDPIRLTVGVSSTESTVAKPVTLVSTANGAFGSYPPSHPDAVAGHANQIVGLSAGQGLSFVWDPAADGLGTDAPTLVILRLYPEDGSSEGQGPFSSCAAKFQVLTNGAPGCAILRPREGSVVGQGVLIQVGLTDPDADLLDLVLEFSTGSGTDFHLMTPHPSSALPNPAIGLAPGRVNFVWDDEADLPCPGGAPVLTTLRGRVTDGQDPGGTTRPVVCPVEVEVVPCQPVLTGCRAVDTLGSVSPGATGARPEYVGGGPLGGASIHSVNPRATYFLDFAYSGVNTGAFDQNVRLVDEMGNPMGNPVVLVSSGADYTGQGGAHCGTPATFQVVLEATYDLTLLDVSAASNLAGTTTWSSSDPSVVSVSPDGLLTARAPNACTTISYVHTPNGTSHLGAPCSGSFLACVDEGGFDCASRRLALATGDVDANLPGLPSGGVPTGPGGRVGITFVTYTGSRGLGLYRLHPRWDASVMSVATTVDTGGIGGSSQDGLGNPSVMSVNAGDAQWEDVDALGTHAGCFDISTLNLTVLSGGTSSFELEMVPLQDAMGEPIAASCLPQGVPTFLSIPASGDVRF